MDISGSYLLKNMTPEISTILCTHNRAKFLRKCLQSLYLQTLHRDRHEVIVVDNGSTDETEKICFAYKNIPGFIYIKEPIIGLSQARNTGWKAAKSNYVGYIDDDATASSQWLEQALYSFQNTIPQPEWVGGPIFLEWEKEPPSWLDAEYETSLGKVYWGDRARFLDKQGERLGGGNSFFRKDVLEKLGGFNEKLGRTAETLLSGEETQLQIRIKDSGGQLYYNPKVIIRHFVPKERLKPMWFYRRYYWGGRSDVIMENSLSSVHYEKISEQQTENSLIERILKNLVRSIGLYFSRDEAIRGRIYFSYVFGRLIGLLKKKYLRA